MELQLLFQMVRAGAVGEVARASISGGGWQEWAGGGEGGLGLCCIGIRYYSYGAWGKFLAWKRISFISLNCRVSLGFQRLDHVFFEKRSAILSFKELVEVEIAWALSFVIVLKIKGINQVHFSCRKMLQKCIPCALNTLGNLLRIYFCQNLLLITLQICCFMHYLREQTVFFVWLIIISVAWGSTAVVVFVHMV